MTNNQDKWHLFERLDEVTEEIEDPGRWPLARDLAVFQGKLALDALRDLALSPISLTAGLLGLIRDPARPGRYFYALMKLGKRSDRWIDLFGASRSAGIDPHVESEPSVDDLVGRLETLVVNQYESGGVTVQAKEAIEKSLSSLQAAAAAELKKLQKARERAREESSGA